MPRLRQPLKHFSMAPIKRKAVTDERPYKKAKSEVKSAAKDGQADPAKPRKDDSGERRPLAKSILQSEERAFPRGGGSVLTPLEHKQIKAQAERDVLFEQETGRPAEHRDEDGELFDDEAASAPAKKKRKTKRQSNDGEVKVPGSGVKIQGLSYKNLVVGSTVLGYVTGVTGRDIALALPNNLTGYVPITAISERLNARIEQLLAEDGEQNDGEEDQDVDLKQLFYIGQWLRAVVTATGMETADGSKSKRHIELSLDPKQVNGGLDSDGGIVMKGMIQASVRSVEDHGVVMDVGLSDNSAKGFVSKKDLGAAYKLDDLQEGQVMMCLVTGKGSSGQVLKLTPDASRFAVLPADKHAPSVSEAPTVDAFMPGTAVDILITESGPGGVVGKIMGMVDVTADVLHSGAGGKEVDLSKKYKVSSKIKGRIIFTLPGDDGGRKVGISLLEHMLALLPPSTKMPEAASTKAKEQASRMEQKLPSSSIVEDAKVVRVLVERGLFLQLPSTTGKAEGVTIAFAHISQIADSRIDSLASSTGAYKLDSTHKVRIIAFNPVDCLYYVSLKQSILDQAFLRIEDLTVGEIVKGTVDRLILGGKSGISGVLVKLSESVTGLVPEMHLSDAQLQHPERKFREGFPVKARVLSVDLDKRHVRLTLKKTLLSGDDEAPMWKDYKDLTPGMQGKGTIINLLPNGAVVQFYSNVRAWLPVAEMSETFVESPEKHFRLGQTVSVRIVSVTAEAQEMKVSCKDGGDFDADKQETWDKTSGGELVSGTVTEKTTDSVMLDLDNGLKGLIRLGQLSDGATAKAENALQHIRIGQKLSELLVLDKLDRSRVVLLSRKSTFVQDAEAGTLIRSFTNVKDGQKVRGFVRNITPEGIYTEFANGVVSLVPKSQIPPEVAAQPAFGLSKDQTVFAWVMSVDAGRERFTLSMREQKDAPAAATKQASSTLVDVKNAVDPTITSMADFKLGTLIKARIASIKATQINVRLADNVQGRIDVSEVFDSWEEVANKRAPLQKFKPNEVLDVKILGMHDARNHRFLPISHRQSSVPVFELSAKKSRVDNSSEELLTMDTVKPESSCLAFVNNHSDNCVWVNLSPNVRGRVALMDLSDDAGQLQNLDKSFPIGCALKVTVKHVDPLANKLDLSAKTSDSQAVLALQDISAGMILAGRVTKITERGVNVQLSDSLAAPVPLVELSDDYAEANPNRYKKNDIVRVCILDVDLPNKKLFITLRPSKILSSSLPVVDAPVTSITQVKPGDMVRGFVKHVAEKGVILSLGARVDAFVRIAHLSDQYVKDWQSIVQIDQLVKGRILAVDENAKHIEISLKASHVDSEYKAPLTMADIEVGMIVNGSIRKVEDFGAFIDIDNTQPRLSGLCHRSEVASKRVEDVRKLYDEGDVVKAKVLNVDRDARKISLGLKASYFVDAGEDDEDEADVGAFDDGEAHDILHDADASADEDSDADGGIDLHDVHDNDVEGGISLHADAEMEVDDEPTTRPSAALKTGGFDWAGNEFESGANGAVSGSEPDVSATKKQRRRKPEIKVDMTGDLDKYGPRSVSDFERQLLGQPNHSGLWIQYMAFQLQLSEVQKARELAERALRTIHIREVEEKANIWIAWLNLEVEYGDDERVEEVFKQSCQVQDALEMHEKLASIYIDSGKHDKADDIFERIVANKTFRASPEVWLNYGTFLLDTHKHPVRGRALLSKAMQSVPINEHRLLTAKFAALEFHSSQGDPERGRTIFEGLITEWPKWSSGWDMWVDLERARLTHVQSEDAKREAKEKARALYERMAAQKMKKRRAKFVFKRWLEFEEQIGDGKGAERVKALAKEYVEAQQAKGGDEMEE